MRQLRLFMMALIAVGLGGLGTGFTIARVMYQDALRASQHAIADLVKATNDIKAQDQRLVDADRELKSANHELMRASTELQNADAKLKHNCDELRALWVGR